MEQQVKVGDLPILRTSENIDKLAEALAAAQAEFPAIPKNRTATIRPREKTPYSFNYADLADVLKAVRPALAKHGLAIVQVVNRDKLETALLHASGQRIVSYLLLYHATNGEPKTFGAELTYLRRYALSALLGVATDDDIDEDGSEAGEPRAPKQEAVRAPARKSESGPRAPAGKAEDGRPEHAPASKAEDSGELASEGERKWLTNRAGESLESVLSEVGAASIDALTKAQFLSAKSRLMRAA